MAPVQLSERVALAFDFWAPPGVFAPSQAFDARWAWARLPRFPVRPVITTQVNGDRLTLPAQGHQQDERELDIAVEDLLWLYQPEAQSLLQAWGAVPLLAAPDIQDQFWARQSPADQVVGDWRNFVPYDTGWPSGNGRIANARMSALEPAFRNPGTLAAGVAQAVRRANP